TFQLALDTTDDPGTGTGDLIADSITPLFTFSTTGLGSGTGDNSHGDTWPRSATTNLVDDPDFAGRYEYVDQLGSVSNDTNVTTTNKQGTAVPKAPAARIPMTVEDSITSAASCIASGYGEAFCAALGTAGTGFGEWSIVNVGRGQAFGALFAIEIYYDATVFPSGTRVQDLPILHLTDEGATETFSEACTFKRGASAPSNTEPCVQWIKLKGNDWKAVVWTDENGGFRA
ncbi:MAG TPA: hypothetical protein VFM44_08860, partial [Gemmatimonadota bacterium]|nr:hypothetical protein [Gemmatimonadota bacterium]